MSKKTNTIIFVVVGTIVNVILSMIFAVAFSLLCLSILPEGFGATFSIVTFAFFGGAILGMFVYQKIANFVFVKFNLEDKLDPIFAANKFKKKKKYD